MRFLSNNLKRTLFPPVLGDSIFFFDGDCGFCNLAVRVLAVADRKESIQFVSLNTSLAKEMLSVVQASELAKDTSVFLTKDARSDNFLVYLKSDAILRAFALSDFSYSLMARAALLVPKPLRDWAYSFIARHRYFVPRSWSQSCAMPTARMRKRLFLTLDSTIISPVASTQKVAK